MKKNIKILGIDPGLNNTGWGIVESFKMSEKHIANGVIKTNKNNLLGDRLNKIFNELNDVCDLHKPNMIAIEKIFVNTNPESSLKLGQARGIGFLIAARRKIDIYEYTANQIKKNIVGYGHASKTQILSILNKIFPEVFIVNEDSADALAVAICHSMNSNVKIKL